MSHKITAAGLAAEVARTDFALPEADWNEQPAAPPRELTNQQKYAAIDAELRRHDLDPGQRSVLLRAQVDLIEPACDCAGACPGTRPVKRTGRATWGPRDRVVYAPRWTSDHHPWAAIGASGEPNGIRYSNQEVDED